MLMTLQPIALAELMQRVWFSFTLKAFKLVLFNTRSSMVSGTALLMSLLQRRHQRNEIKVHLMTALPEEDSITDCSEQPHVLGIDWELGSDILILSEGVVDVISKGNLLFLAEGVLGGLGGTTDLVESSCLGVLELSHEEVGCIALSKANESLPPVGGL